LGGYWPLPRVAPDPSLIIWKNIGITRCSQCCRQLLVFVVSVTAVILSFVFIIWVIQRRDNLKENSWNASVCGSNVYGKEEAIAALTSKTKNYIKECFCYQRF
jgi:hypothetical protein